MLASVVILALCAVSLFWCHNTFGLSCMGFLSDGAAPDEGPVGRTDVKIFDAGFDVVFVAVIA